MKPLRVIPRTKFNQIYRNFIRAHYVTRNEVIYTEGTVANNFYIIYEGQFRLKKNLSQKKDSIQNFYQSDVAKHHVVLYLTNGDFAGLEAFMNYDYNMNFRNSLQSQIHFENEIYIEKFHTQQNNSETARYKNSLVAESEYNVVFSLNPNILSFELRKDLCEFLQPIFEKRENFISEIFKNHQAIKEKMKLTYREKIITNISKNNNKKLIDKIDELGVDDNYLRIIKPLHFERIKKQNELKNLQINSSSIGNERNKKNYHNTHDTHNSGDHSNHITKEENILNTNFKLNTTTYQKTEKSSTSNNDYFNTGNSFMRKLSMKSFPSKSPLNSENKKRFTVDINSIDKSLFLTDKSRKIQNNPVNTIPSFERKDLIIEKGSCEFLKTVRHMNKNTTIKENSVNSRDTFKRIKLKITICDKDKVTGHIGDEIGKYVHKYVAKTINNWNRLSKDAMKDFSSGDFNLPLVSRINTTSGEKMG
jgi:hypothetical protein